MNRPDYHRRREAAAEARRLTDAEVRIGLRRATLYRTVYRREAERRGLDPGESSPATTSNA